MIHMVLVYNILGISSAVSREIFLHGIPVSREIFLHGIPCFHN